ncbi:MAG: hypothetical protein COV70_00490 [Parcubacteria group bacterium CG11_big_fil_rev_8_21_14_0_20_39_22]|nr:MAG: hypothetical protein COV70_00490 [Parcubacteria group bacterium CG11_big_fil_rev_8_21_14_0_20_39_22]
MGFFGSIRSTYKKHERHATTIAFVIGFIWDSLTLTRIDRLYDNLVLTSYLVIAAVGIVVWNAYETPASSGKNVPKIVLWLPLLIQFAFGGLFSGYIIFYSRSASLFASWPFLLFLSLFFFGNELFKKKYLRLAFQVSVFFIATFSYFTFSIPVLIGRIGAWVFILSSIVSLITVLLLIKVLKYFSRERVEKSRRYIISGIVTIFILFNVSYFANIIPPIPLSLKDIGIAHSVSITKKGEYSISYEPTPWYIPRTISRTYNRYGNEPVYVFSSIFAPTGLTATVYHDWLFYKDSEKIWVKTDHIPFTVEGGAGDGYKGYTFKRNISPGKWRVQVVTERGQIIGQINFEVKESPEPASLIDDFRE